MEKTIKSSKQQGLSVSTENKQQSNGKLIDYHEVENTPFTVVKKEDGKCIIVLGSQQVSSRVFDSKDQAIIYIEQKPWELILIASSVFTNKVINNQKSK